MVRHVSPLNFTPLHSSFKFDVFNQKEFRLPGQKKGQADERSPDITDNIAVISVFSVFL